MKSNSPFFPENPNPNPTPLQSPHHTMSSSKPPPKLLFDRYTLGRILGRGTYATVHSAHHLPTSTPVAIKILPKSHLHKPHLLREIAALRRLHHPNIVSLHELLATRNRVFLVLDLAPLGPVSSGPLPEPKARKYFHQLISAVGFCHTNGVFHRDIKPDNILLDAHDNVLVSDFGLSALNENVGNDGMLRTRCGTPAYVAPEVLRSKGYSGAEADLWSCGVVLYEMLVGFPPFRSDNDMRMYVKILKAEFRYPPWVSSAAKRVVSRLLVVDPEKRATAREIMEDPWVKEELDCIKIETPVVVKKTVEGTQKSGRTTFNAFELIAKMSSGFDLSRMFEFRKKAGTVFTSKRSVEEIVEALVNAGEDMLGFEVGRLEEYKVRFERSLGLVVVAEVFEVTKGVELVEFGMVVGDELEFERFCEMEVRPRVKDIVWTWQGDDRSID